MIINEHIIGKLLKNRYVPECQLGSGVYGTTYAGRDTEFDAPVAIKLLMCPNPEESWKAEARKAAKLRNKSPHIAQVYDYGEHEYSNGGVPEKYPFLIYELVEGTTLESFLNDQTNISQEFIIQFVNDICESIAVMHKEGLEHGDLHTKNIMITDSLLHESNKTKRIKIIDFGQSRLFLGERYSSDIKSLIEILKIFFDKNQRYEGKKIERDKQISQWLPTLIKKLEDSEATNGLFDPLEILTELRQFKERSILREAALVAPLTDPFEFLDVIQIPEDTSLLQDLFVPMPWYQEIESFANTLISGPRGSGKSMILRHMRFKTKLYSKEFRENGFNNERFIGFYLHCHPSIYMPFSAKQIKYNKKTLDMLLHYIHLQITFEVLDTIVTAEKFNVIMPTFDGKRKLFEFIAGFLQQPGILLENIDPIVFARNLIERELKITQRGIIDDVLFDKRTDVGYLFDLCEQLSKHVAYFENKRFFFLIDDYSHPNVNFEIQHSFNRVIRSKNPRYCFKISTEKFSLDPIDFDGKQLQQNHEYSYIDLGEKFLSQPLENDVDEFMENVLNKRLRHANINMTARQIFGIYSPPKKSFPASLADPETRKDTLYAGFHIIAMLCSGDLRTLLELCKEIFREANWNREQPSSIPLKIQDRAIRQFSRNYLSEIKEQVDGDDLLIIATAFGDICKKYLYEYGPIGNAQNERYYEMIKIEIEGVRPLKNERARAIYENLLRYSIFLDGGEGYPRQEELTTRLIFRRIYTPAFQISYRNAESLRLSPSDFEKFLLNPEEFKRGGTRFLLDSVRYREMRERKSDRRLEDFGIELEKEKGDSK